MRYTVKLFFTITMIMMVHGTCVVAQKNKPQPPITVGADGKLVYTSDAQSNRVPDFSYVGYKAGEQPIPTLPIRMVVPEKKGDATQRIQSALDYVSSLPADKNGIRGCVLLEKGTYEISGSLLMATPGVVLRGSGMDLQGTILLGTGTTRETLIRVIGKNDRQVEQPVKITDAYVPVNARQVKVTSTHLFQVGDKIVIRRPSTKEWIQKLSMEEFGGETAWLGWKPNERDLYWDREILAVKDNVLTFDAPLTTALEDVYGGGEVINYNWKGRATEVGIENLRCVSSYDATNNKDEDHRWMAITMENVQDAWIRRVTFEHFAGSAVAIYETAKRITVEDCKSFAPVSEIGGQRRYTFFTNGQQVLFQRLYSEYGYHDFGVGFCAPGPNAFVQCESHGAYSFSGTLDSWASGVLFDVINVDGQALGFSNRGQDGQGAGWTAANSVLWQCTASKLNCYQPPTANNWAFGAWSQFAGNGYWSDNNNHVKPRSLYYAQLADRLGNAVMQNVNVMPFETEASSSPTIEQANALTAQAAKPVLLLTNWIDQIIQQAPLFTDAKNVKSVDQIEVKRPKDVKQINTNATSISNGWLVNVNAVLTGRQQDVAWWRGDVRPHESEKAKSHVTRFVPGRNGNGLTDDLNEVTENMKKNHVVALEHNYGLWYDRRRDDHERIRRIDGEVWPPFYELPFARSGKEIGWDGLSKYDLTKYNPWYWNRLKQFADVAGQKGLMLIHQQYFQHNILEAGAHYADFPWRTANNINDTGFPEPPPYAGDKRIFLAEQFYDITNPVRRQLHQSYIRKCLDNFAGNSNVIQLTSAEYTGPLHFIQFWLDTILAWEKETGKKVIVGLSTTRDVQDAILADPERNSVVNLIDIRYWHYRDDGRAYAPSGGKNLAPRQHARLVKPGRSSFDKVYQAVSEYKQKFPSKAVIYSGDGADAHGWAIFMAGGSLANIPVIDHPDFLTDASVMQPVQQEVGQFVLSNIEKGRIIYSNSSVVSVDLTKITGLYNVLWLNPADGRVIKEDKIIKAGSMTELKSPKEGAVVLWISKHKNS